MAADAPGPETILVIEDDPSVRLLVRMILERAGHSVLEAAEDEEALVLCRARDDIRLVVLDVMLARTSGRDLRAQILQELPGTEVLFISGYTEGALIERGLLEPGSPFLHKPFMLDSLGAKVRDLLEATR